MHRLLHIPIVNITAIALLFAFQIGAQQSTDSGALPDGAKILEERPGKGRLVESGDKITIQYQVKDGLNRELASTCKRGMTYTLVVGERNSDRLLSVALTGMKVGGIRLVLIPSNSVPQGIGSIVPPKTDLRLWINVVAAKAYSLAKVESSHVERTQGTLAVPGTSAHHGGARTQNSL